MGHCKEDLGTTKYHVVGIMQIHSYNAAQGNEIGRLFVLVEGALGHYLYYPVAILK
jgi:hypothetical protein